MIKTCYRHAKKRSSKIYEFYVSSRFSSNSETFASELLENLEEMFPRYYIHGSKFIPYYYQYYSVLPVAKVLIRNKSFIKEVPQAAF